MDKEVTLLTAADDEFVELTGILNGELNRVEVTVEDEFDVPFWLDLLTSVNAQASYHISPYQYDEDGVDRNGKGKAHILQMEEDGLLGPHNIGCVDADYDYLRKKVSDDWKTMDTQRILHTYTYSIENLMCHPQTLQQVCCDATMEVVDYDFENLFKKIGKTVYPLLVWSMYMVDIDSNAFTPKSWGKIFDSTTEGKHSYSIDDIKNELESRVKETIKELEIQFPEHVEKLKQCEKDYLNGDDVEPENCYQFVRGHDLYDYIRDRLLKHLTQEAKSQHIAAIKASNPQPGDDIQHYRKNLIEVEHVLPRNYGYKGYSPYYRRMKADEEKALA